MQQDHTTHDRPLRSPVTTLTESQTSQTSMDPALRRHRLSVASVRMRRRPVIALTTLIVALALLGAVLVPVDPAARQRIDPVDPYAWGVEVRADGERAVIRPGTEATYLPGSRVLTPPPSATDAEARAARDRAEDARSWLTAATIP